MWDIGDGILCLEFHSKMNAIDPDILAMIYTAVDIIPNDYNALVLYNEGTNYSVGANIGLALFAANVAAWPQIEGMVKSGQDTYKSLKHAPFPSWAHLQVWHWAAVVKACYIATPYKRMLNLILGWLK